MYLSFNYSKQRDVKTSELMMMDRIIVSDIQKDISDIQTDLKNRTEEANLMTSTSCKETEIAPKHNPRSIDDGESNVIEMEKPNIHKIMLDEKVKTQSDKIPTKKIISAKSSNPYNNITNSDLALGAHGKFDTIKDEVKGEPDLIPTTVQQFNTESKSLAQKCAGNTAQLGNVLMASDAIVDDKSTIQESISRENNLSLDLNFSFDHIAKSPKRAANPNYDIKKEMENLDIESEITPSFIIKKCDQTNRVHSPLSTSDFDYLCGSTGSGNGASGSTATNTMPTNRKKDELISCDKEPYDEWLCIQKELNLITEKQSNEHHLNNDGIMDGFMDSTLRNFNNSPCSNAKLSVENQFSDLFNHRPNHHHHDLHTKSDIVGNHSPLSDLFNDSIVSNTTPGVTDKSVENRLENMFSDSSEFEKTNDLVESRLEELFHGSTSPPTSSVSSQPFHNNHTHVEDNSNFLMVHQNQTEQISTQNKRQWSNNGDLLSQISPSELLPSKRSCMMTSYMETTTSDDHQWIMECQQTAAYDFMTNENNLDNNSTKRLWNGTNNDCDGNGNGSRNTGGIMNGLTCDNNSGGVADNMLINNIDHKKQCYNSVSVKNHDLERDLLGLSAHSSPSPLDNANSVLMQLQQSNHLHNENSFDTSTMPGSGSTANTSNNSITSNFEDDINRHVQNAIDSILNLQNSESETLQYFDQNMGSFLTDNPLAPSFSTTSVPLTSSTITAASNRSNMQHHLHQQSLHHSNLQQQQQHHNNQNHYINNMHTHKRRNIHYDDSSDCLISGSRSMNDANVDMMIDSPPTLQQSASGNMSASTNITDFMGIDDPVKSIITS